MERITWQCEECTAGGVIHLPEVRTADDWTADICQRIQRAHEALSPGCDSSVATAAVNVQLLP